MGNTNIGAYWSIPVSEISTLTNGMTPENIAILMTLLTLSNAGLYYEMFDFVDANDDGFPDAIRALQNPEFNYVVSRDDEGG